MSSSSSSSSSKPAVAPTPIETLSYYPRPSTIQHPRPHPQSSPHPPSTCPPALRPPSSVPRSHHPHPTIQSPLSDPTYCEGIPGLTWAGLTIAGLTLAGLTLTGLTRSGLISKGLVSLVWHRAESPCFRDLAASCRKCAHTRTRAHTHTLVLCLPLLKPSMAMTRPRTEVGHSLPPPSSACCQLSVSSSLDLQTDYSGVPRHVVASDPKALPGSPSPTARAAMPSPDSCAKVCSPSLGAAMSPMPARLTSDPRNALSHEAVIRCRHDSAARSPSACLCCAPSANAGYSFRYFKVASMKHGRDHGLVFR